MSKVKIKKIKIPAGAQDEGLAEMFNQMLGTGGVVTSIAYPRYLRIKELCEQLVKLFEILAPSPPMRLHSELAAEKIQLEDFCTRARDNIAELFQFKFENSILDLDTVNENKKKEFAENYERVKKSDLVNTFIIMCSNLAPYKKSFIDINNLSHTFILTMAGTEWKPFPFTGLNIKHVFSLPGIKEPSMRLFMTILHKAFELSRKLYDEISSPDIDIDKFIGIIISNMSELEKNPELCRCRKAFDKIRESVNLLKDRFNTYYRDFISAKDSTIIMQHFILDVSKETTADAQVTAQFRKIIQYYRKVAQTQTNDPKIKMLFEKVDKSFKELERGADNIDAAHTVEDDYDIGYTTLPINKS